MKTLAAALSLLLALGPGAMAAAPQRVLYQGTLRRSGALFTGNATFLFRVTDLSGATQYWTSGSTVVAVNAGLFRYPLGITNTGADGGFPSVSWASIDPYVEVTVDGTVLSPREPMVSVPYALYNLNIANVNKYGDSMIGPLTMWASSITIVNQISTAAFSLAVTTATDRGIYHLYVATTGRVGIGTSAPGAQLEVANGGLLVSGGDIYASKDNSGIAILGGDIGLAKKAGDSGFWAVSGTTEHSWAKVTGSVLGGGGVKTEQMRLTTAGDLGVGFNAPQGRLEVRPAEANAYSLFVSSQNGNLILGVDKAGDVYVGPHPHALSGGDLSANPDLLVSGNVIIDGQFISHNGSGSSVTFSSNGDFVVGTSTFVVTQGRIGIGLTNPASILELASGQIALPSGSSGAPPLSFTGDLNVGLFRPLADNLGLVASDRARFYAAGDANPFVDVTRNVSVFSGGEMLFGAGGGAAIENMGIGRLGVNTLGLATNGVEAMRIDSSQRVGIGTTNPARTLDVRGHINAATAYQINGSTVLASPGNGNFLAGTGAGNSTQTGGDNTFLGANAGLSNTGGGDGLFAGANAGASNTTGDRNAFLGWHAGQFNLTGGFNAYLGALAGNANTGGSNNSVLGYRAGYNSTASSNTFLGAEAGYQNTSGTGNVAVGPNAGASNATTSGNTTIGSEAGYSNLAAEFTAVGYRAGRDNTSGTTNTFLGYRAGMQTTSGNNNTMVGHDAGLFNTTGIENTLVGAQAAYQGAASRNTVMGYNAGYNTAGGSQNVYLGAKAGYAAVGGTMNVYVGQAAGENGATGSSNTYVGQGAGNLATGKANTNLGFRSGFNSTASSNTFVGFEAGYQNTTGADNLFIGASAGASNTSGSYLLAIGPGAGYRNTTGGQSVFVGYRAGASNTTGLNNTFLGHQAGAALTTGNSNTFVGGSAGFNTTTANSNSFFGEGSGQVNTTGASNTFLGALAGNVNSTGLENTFVGKSAGAANTTSNYNSFFGSLAGDSNTTGVENSFFGRSAGNSNTTGSRNAFLGVGAGNDNSVGTDNVFLGYNAGYTETGSNKLYIANTSANPPLIFGDFSSARLGLGTISPATKLHMSSGVLTLDGTTAGLTADADKAAEHLAIIRNRNATGLGLRLIAGADTLAALTVNDATDAANKHMLYGNGKAVFGFNGGNVGINTINPAFKLHISSGSLVVDGNGGKIETASGGTATTIACASGAGEAFVGNDMAGRITIGAFGAAACTVTFATAYTNEPICTAGEQTTPAAIAVLPAAGSLVLTATFVAADVINYICIGRR